jgi:hypothetical protein
MLSHNVEVHGGVILAISHPGHELRLARWVAEAKPTIFILTSGSRSGASRSRVQASAQLAADLGARTGSIFGGHLDREVYDWIIAGQAKPFADLAGQLADALVRERARMVVTDSWQLYNVVHDLWHLVVRAAAAMASARLQAPVEVLDYAVVPDCIGMRALGQERRRIDLTPAEVRRKLDLAAAYPEIANDVADVIEQGGQPYLSSESLHTPRPYAELRPAPGEKPPYESYGEARVAAGLYKDVLRWRHVEPVASALASRFDLEMAL